REVLNVQAARHLAAEGVAALLQAPVFDGGRLAGALTACAAEPRCFCPGDERLAVALAELAGRVLEVRQRGGAAETRRLGYLQLGQVTRRIEAAREEERRLLARELHDELGQTLTAVKLSLRRLARGPLGAGLEEPTRMVERALATTRELSRML